MLIGSSWALRASAATTLASIAFLGGAPRAAMADASERDTVLADIAQAVHDAPERLGLKVDFKALDSYSTEELKSFRAALPTDYVVTFDGDSAPARVPGHAKLSAAGPVRGCKTANGRLTFVGGLTKAKLWYFQVSVNFCWDYGARTITSIGTAELQGHIYGPGNIQGWHYRGPHQGSPVNTAFDDVFGTAHYETYAQALFELCTIKIACPVESNPWIRVSTYRDGSFGASKGGEK